MKLALFDLDQTLLPLDSDQSWGEFTLNLGWVDRQSFKERNDSFYADYNAGCLDIHAYVRFATEAMRQRGLVQAQEAHQAFMREVIQPAITPQALELVEQHRAQGETLVMVTATNEFVTGPIAQAFGMDVLLAVQLVRDEQGNFTGDIDGTPSLREGKVTRVNQWLAEQGLSLPEVHATFYSDSMNDLPLLEKVDVPVVTNAGPELKQIAQERGWRILDLFETS
jgi:HAD superfamily hydrolase (TIGR01490 family)